MNRLILIVSTKCNMACSYCYAKGGHYNGPETIMQPSMSIDVFEHFRINFGGVQRILFFGGEPLIGLDAILSLCKHIDVLVDAGTLAAPPEYGIVTNGTILAKRPRFLELAKVRNFSVVVSIDGPKRLNDQNRLMKNGKGSFQRITEGLDALSAHGIPFSLECTYTDAHEAAGYSPRDLYEFLLSYGPKQVILVEAIAYGGDGSATAEFPRHMIPYWQQLFNEALDTWKRTGEMRLAGPGQVIVTLLKPELLNDRFCEGGLETFAVNPQGIVYPCHLLVNNPTFRLGHYRNVIGPFDILPCKSEISDCSSCLLKPFCYYCPATMYLEGESRGFRPSRAKCELKKEIFASVCGTLMRQVADSIAEAVT